MTLRCPIAEGDKGIIGVIRCPRKLEQLILGDYPMRELNLTKTGYFRRFSSRIDGRPITQVIGRLRRKGEWCWAVLEYDHAKIDTSGDERPFHSGCYPENRSRLYLLDEEPIND